MSQGQSASRNRLAGCQPGSRTGDPVRPEGAANRKQELVILIKSTVIQNENSWRRTWSRPGARPGSRSARSSGRRPGASRGTVSGTLRPQRTSLRHHPGYRIHTFIAASHQEALNTLLVALARWRGFIKDHRRSRYRKSLLCRRLLRPCPGERLGLPAKSLPGAAHCCWRWASGPRSRSGGRRLPSPAGSAASSSNMRPADRQVVVCIDEAQAMPRETLEALRLLSTSKPSASCSRSSSSASRSWMNLADPAVRPNSANASPSLPLAGVWGGARSAITWRTACGLRAIGAKDSSRRLQPRPLSRQPGTPGW